MAYKWTGMRKLDWEEVKKLHENGGLVGCFKLYPDGSEGQIESGYDWRDIEAHHLNGGGFGSEKRPQTAGGRKVREILFRAKRIDTGEWIIGYFLKDEIGCYICENDCISTNLGMDNRYGIYRLEIRAYEIDVHTLCQYTGLTDKNGMKIFEWDNLKTSDGRIFTVECEKEGRFLGFTAESERRIVYINREPKIEIIGNVFNNPEMMGK